MDILAAEKQIAAILKSVEIAYDSYVESVDVKNIEITKFGDVRPEFVRTVTIDLKRKPGSRWTQADAQ